MFDFDIDSFISLHNFKEITGLDIEDFSVCRQFFLESTVLKLSIPVVREDTNEEILSKLPVWNNTSFNYLQRARDMTRDPD